MNKERQVKITEVQLFDREKNYRRKQLPAELIVLSVSFWAWVAVRSADDLTTSEKKGELVFYTNKQLLLFLSFLFGQFSTVKEGNKPLVTYVNENNNPFNSFKEALQYLP